MRVRGVPRHWIVAARRASPPAVGRNRLGRVLAPHGVSDLFNGKRRDRTAYGLDGGAFELEGYDHGARIYLPELGRLASADAVVRRGCGGPRRTTIQTDDPLRAIPSGDRTNP